LTAKAPFFSIVIPTYNRAGFILDTLGTVFAQTFQDFEVIVVDNASTDNTAELLHPLAAQEKIKYLKHDKNYERAKSRNTGQENATGTFVTFLDSDDFMYPNKLRDAYDFAMANPTCRFFHNLYELVDENRKRIYLYPFHKLKNPIKQICEGNFLSCIGVFLHRDLFSKVRWDENPLLTGSEDYDFWIRVMALEKTVCRIEKINSGILHHPGRTMNNPQTHTAAERFRYIISKIENTPQLLETYGPYLKKLGAFRWLFLAGIARSISYRETLKYLAKAIRTDVSVVFSFVFYSNIYFLLTRFLRRI
jgi:glycosyltransferase involved in cell wall biosynthesis